MPRLFLAWLAALGAASWCGIVLAELDAFAAWAAVAYGGVAFVACLAATARGGWPLGPRSALLPVLAVALTASLVPVVDTTLLSQDASVHRASGRWLARSGSLGVPDETFAGLGEDDRLKLFGGASVSPQRVSLTRLPGGIVLPDTKGTVAYPSFSHLLAVWVAIADGIGGPAAIALLGPLFAATAWWAIGLLALLDAGWLAALAAPLLLASFFPEHWFARFLMPELLGQALVWSGVAAARLAETAAPAARARTTAALLCGFSLGLAAFARLEQFWVFVPLLLLTRAVLPRERRLFPRGALVPFVLVAVHASLHVFVVPTDYANRIFKALIQAYARFVVLVSTLTGHDGYVTGFILGRVLPVVVPLVAALALFVGWRIDRRRPGFLARWSAAVVALPWLALLYRGGLPEEFPALRSLLLYVPWPLVVAIGFGALRQPAWSGLEIALVLQAVEQLVSARVTDQQPWASRRLVTVVLPVVVLAAVRALAADRSAGGVVARARPVLERRVACAVVALALLLASARLAPVAGRSLQSGAGALASRIAGALPESAYVIVAQPLDWVHLGPALWLGEGRMTLVARAQPWFPPALARFLALEHDRPLYVLSGAVVSPDEAGVHPGAFLPPLPARFALEPVATFDWRGTLLESSVDRRPDTLEERALRLQLYRMRAGAG